MLHTVAYHYATLLVGDGLKALPPVTDTIFATSGTGLLLPSDLKLVAAYAGSTSMLRARVNAPSLLRVGFPSIRPVMQNATISGAASPDPNFMPLIGSPLTLRANEPVGVDAATSAASERAIGLLWFADKIEPVPQGEGFSLRFTTTAAIVTGQEGTWVVITPVFDQAFPSGTYAVTGLEFTGPGAVAARIVFPGSLYRPGVLAQPGSLLASPPTVGATRTAQSFYDGSFGTRSPVDYEGRRRLAA